jgi:hypothetical protein
MSKSKNRNVRIAEEVDDQLRLLAASDRRSLNKTVEVLIVEEIRRRELAALDDALDPKGR